MNIFSDLAAVQGRISELGGAQVDGDPQTSGLNAYPVTSAEYQTDPNAAETFRTMMATALNRRDGIGMGAQIVPPAELEPFIAQNAAKYQVDPALIKAIIANESGFNAAATSPVGAQGLMQLMPSTAVGLGVSNAYDPAQNIAGGTRYLRGLYDRLGDWRLAVAAYNAGPNAVAQYGGIPPYPETRAYVANVFDSFKHYSRG